MRPHWTKYASLFFIILVVAWKLISPFFFTPVSDVLLSPEINWRVVAFYFFPPTHIGKITDAILGILVTIALFPLCLRKKKYILCASLLLLVIGIFANMLVFAANGFSMPVVATSDEWEVIALIERSPMHHFAHESSRLLFLADSIRIGHTHITSPGDMMIRAGMVVGALALIYHYLLPFCFKRCKAVWNKVL